ncbi:MAG: AMP-dependent synthetase/ligase, partial [Fidelibacterota bacterium]
FTAFSKGSTVYYSESIETLPQNMIDVKPTVMLSVPRLYEKMYAKVLDNIRTESNAKQKIFWWSISTGREILEYKLNGKTPPFMLRKKYGIAKKLVFDKIKDKIGGRLRYFVSGGAPLSQEIAEFFAAANVMILEGYGLTETSPVLTANTPTELRFGTVGKPLNNVEVKIAQDGEIIVRGPNIMMGYYKNDTETKEVLDDDGWFSTGDIGFLDDDGYLKITDRKKNLLVTSGGKNVAPLVNSIYIDQAVVIGDKRNFISALIVPNFEYVSKYLTGNGISLSDPEAIIEHPDAISLFDREVQKSMESFSNYERVKKFSLISSPFTIEKGEITPSLKVVRKVVISNYSNLIESMYSEGKK